MMAHKHTMFGNSIIIANSFCFSIFKGCESSVHIYAPTSATTKTRITGSFEAATRTDTPYCTDVLE